MSRIILTRWPNGQERLTVGYDHAVSPPGCFWTEFSREPDGDPETWPDDWREVIRDGGMMDGIPIGALIDSMPEDLRAYVTPEVIELLYEHEQDPDSGYGKPPVDLSRSASRD